MEVVQEEKDRRQEVLVPLEQLAVGYLAQCCDGMPCEHQDHVWTDMTYTSTCNVQYIYSVLLECTTLLDKPTCAGLLQSHE